MSNLFDGDPKNAWKPVSVEKKAWIEVDLGEKFNTGNFSVVDPWHQWNDHCQEFLLQYKKDIHWVDIVSGKTLGPGYSQDFAPVTEDISG